MKQLQYSEKVLHANALLHSFVRSFEYDTLRACQIKHILFTAIDKRDNTISLFIILPHNIKE